jgi:hypothetical protein
MPAPQSPTQQTAGHSALGWVVVVVMTTAVLGCGDVHFLPAPFTPQNVELVYSAQEHLTIVRWRVDTAAPPPEVRFELLGPDGYKPIDFSRSLFAGGVAECGDHKGSCGQYVVRDQYPQHLPAGQFRPIRAFHDTYGELPGAPAKSRTIETTVEMVPFFNFENDPVFVNFKKDNVASDGPYKFPRAFERALWPSAGLCIAETPPDDVVFYPLDLMTGIPPEQPLTEAGLYCVAIRPVPADGGSAVLLQERIATLPELVTAQQTLNPPVEVSPIIYQVILDLEIPVDDRCAEAVATIQSVTSELMQGGNAAVRKLPTINLSPGCKQSNDRTIAAAEVAEGVKQAVMTFSEVHHQYHFMYFNNLDGPLPAKLTQSLKELFAALGGAPAGHDLQTLPFLFSPPTTALSELPWIFTPWKTYDDMEFEVLLGMYTRGNLPYRTQLHRADIPVPLLSPEDVQTYDGKLIKICTASPEITPVSAAGSYPIPIFDPTWKIRAADPPAYLVGLPEQVVVPDSAFVASQARVSYQICTRYCSKHPYVTQGGKGEDSWEESVSCASKDY